VERVTLGSFAAILRGDLAGLLGSIDYSGIRSKQAWVLTIMRKDGAAIVRLLWRMLGREDDVLDAYQECFCKLIALAEKGGDPPCRSFVFKVATNVALDMARRRKTQRTHLVAVAELASHRAGERAASAATSDLLIEELRAAIESLPERLRDVIVLRDLAELSYRDVATTLNLTTGTARVYRREAVILLSQKLGAA
jgi:RNA polymerase sigma-70 factor (ECF subfamily)